MPEPTEPTPETPRPAMTMREIRHALGHRIEQPGPEQYVVTVNQLARILNSTSSHQTPWRAWPNLTDEERDAYESTAACELADYGIRPLAPAGAPHGPQDAAGTVGAGTETPDSGTGPQTGAQAIEWPDYTAISTYRHTATGRHAWAARCWGNGPCAGWVGLDHDTERWAQVALARHLRDDHNVVVKLPEQMPSAPPSGLRERIADALEGADYRPGMRRGDLADAVLAVIEPDRARLVAEMARCRELNRQLVNDALQAGATAPAVNGIADKLDEFIAASAADGANEDWLRDRIRAALEDVMRGNGWDGELTDDGEREMHQVLDAVLPAVHRYTEQLAAGRETWRRRAEEIEADRDRLARTVDRMRRTNRMVNGTARAARERAEQAEATMQRVLDELDALDDHINADHTPDPEYDQGLRHTVARIRAALAASATPQ